MKNFGLLIIVLFISVLSIAQQPTYTRVFSGHSYDEGIAAFRLPNKEIRLIGNTGSYGHGSTDVWLIALDSNGNFLWHKFYGGPKIEKVEAAVMTAQGDLFMVGSTTQNTAASYQLYFLGLDQYGNIIGYNNYGGKDWDFGYGICTINDSTFALIGETYSQGAGQSDIFLLKVNRLGDILWTKTYGGVLEDKGNAVELMPDGGFIVAGASKSFGNGSYDFYMLRLDEFGDSIWTKVRNHITDAEFMDVVVNPDTSLVFSGYRKDTLDLYRDTELMKFNQDASFIWSRHNSLSEQEDCYASPIIREANGDFVYGGITNRFSHSQYSNARVVRTSSTGWWKASVSIGDLKEDIGNSITLDVFNGKHYFLIGSTKSYGVSRSGLFFVRLDSNFQYDTSRIISTPTYINSIIPKETIRVYPNPVKDVLYFNLPIKGENVRIIVYDISGRQVLNRDYFSNNSTYRISTKNLAKGIYQLSIKSNRVLFQSRFIKISDY